MSLEKRIENAEKALPTDKTENCQILVYEISGDVIVPSAPEGAALRFMRESGKCKVCKSGLCAVYWDGEKFSC